MTSRDDVLARIRAAVRDAPDVPVPDRDYRTAHVGDDPGALLDLLAHHLDDYRATVHRVTAAGLPDAVARILAGHAVRRYLAPAGVPAAWLATATGERHTGDGLAPGDLDAFDAVVTGCALAIAETGTLVLDAGPDQGRRALTLVPDVHVCVVRSPAQLVASVPRAMPRLDARRPLTWFSGPSATSDIELDRVEGVHGPRTLHAVLVED